MRQFISYVFSNKQMKARLSKLRLHLILVWDCSFCWVLCCLCHRRFSGVYLERLGVQIYEKMLSLFHELQALRAIFHIVPNYHNRVFAFLIPSLPVRSPINMFSELQSKICHIAWKADGWWPSSFSQPLNQSSFIKLSLTTVYPRAFFYEQETYNKGEGWVPLLYLFIFKGVGSMCVCVYIYLYIYLHVQTSFLSN